MTENELPPADHTTDWARDLDVLDERYVEDPAAIWAELRPACPVAFGERGGRSWMPIGYSTIAAVAQDTTHFSSRRIGVVDPPPDPNRTRLEAPPITADPPVHTWSRRVLLPAFSPRRVEEMTPITRSIAGELLDDITGRRSADAATDYAQHIPTRVISHMLGVPAADEEQFTQWSVRILQEGFRDSADGVIATKEVLNYFEQRVEQRREVPAAARPDDLLTLLIEAEHDEAPLDDRHVLGTCFLLLLAGIDTTWSAIGASIWHLATHPVDQERLRDDPTLIDSAVEEFLRIYSPVTMAREVVGDAEIDGCPVRTGDKVLMAFGAGNRDPSQFEHPDDFVIDRDRNRHFAFGSGIHRCLGSNLARMELRVAIEEWMARVPSFELSDADAVTWTGGQVRGPRRVPVRW